ncbi:MAG: DegT/DnrJ/EryC1/StrS family aminotransferase [Deferribacteraceae bacterium]|jgi:dTDP-4-amino-4,6-dideoxygalactose transaminase|nr:DegT/DnrJ/EryC1/StrS family aminotransferase [Deferribacteraceae bacterium]
MIPYSKQNIDAGDAAALLEALNGGVITGGAWVERFENALAETTGARYAVALSSGTAALHTAYIAAGLSAGDELITSPITFAATSNAALYLNAVVKFADIELSTGNMNAETAISLITPKTKVIAPVDYAGLAFDNGELYQYTRSKGIFIVEDACHALGGSYKSGERIGSCSFSDMTVFSFHPVKHITTGEGGAVTTNDRSLYEKLKLLRSHGIYTDPERKWIKEMALLGLNYRLTDFQSALGVNQLKRLDIFIKERRRIAEVYDREVGCAQAVGRGNSTNHAYHLYPVLLSTERKRNALLEAGVERGIGFQVHYFPVYQHPYYKQNGYSGYEKRCPIAQDFSSRVVSLPIYPFMDEADQQKVLTSLTEVDRWG